MLSNEQPSTGNEMNGHAPTYEELKRRLADAETALQGIRREQAEAEAREAHIKQVLLAVRNVNQLIVRETDPERLIQKACANLTETLGYHNAWIALLDETGDVTMTASSGFDGGFTIMQGQLKNGDFPACMRQGLSQEHAVVVKDPVISCADCPLSPEYGGRAGMTHRLSHDGTVYGILSVSVPAAYAFDPEEQGLFDELADDMGFALSKTKAEEQIRRYTHIVRTIPHPMSFVSRDYRYLAVNDVYAALYNVPKKTIVGRKVSDFFGEAVFEEEIRPYLERCLAGETVRYQSKFEFPDQIVRWMGMEYHPYRDEKGRVVAVVSHGLDITKQKEIEDRLQKTLHATTGGIWYWHFPTNQLTFGPRYYTMLGYEPDEFAPTFENWLELIHPEDRAAALSIAEEYIRTKPDYYENEFRLRMKDGQYRWIHSRARVVERSQDGEAVLMIGNHEDITSSKLDQEALAESERQKGLILNATSEMVAYYDLDLRVIWANRAAETSVGAAKGALRGRHCYEIWAQRDDACPNCPVLKARDTREPQETEQETPDGRCWHVRGFPIIDEVGKLVALAEFTQDITEQKRAEDRFRRSQAMLARTERIAHIGSWEWEIAADVVTWSEELYRIFGIDPSKPAPTWADHPALYHPEDFECLRHAAERATSDGTPYELELRALRKDGETRICLSRGFAEMGPEGRAVRLFGSFQDITDRKRAEGALRESEERLRLAHKATRDVVWDWDIVNDAQMWNEAGSVVFGWTDIVAHPQTAGWWAEKIHPEDRDRVDKSFFSVVDNPAEDYWHDEYRFLKADGTYAHVIDRGYVLRDDQGKALRMIGAMLDITDRKRAEEALRVSEQRFRSITEQTSDVISLTDHEGFIIYVSPSCRQVFDAESEEMVGRHFSDFLDESAVPVAMEGFQRAIEGRAQSKNLELLMKRKDGSRFYGELNGSAYASESGIGTLVLIRDITERKQAEKEKQRLEEQFQQAQKLEAIGRLAGGVAHDFNNMLGVIIANAESAEMGIRPDQPVYKNIHEILNASHRAADTVSQLLAFARKQTVSPRILDLDDTISGALKMLRRLIGEDITLRWIPGKQVGKVRMDPTQVHQILANLIVNSRDAMCDGGTVTIQTANKIVDESHAASHNGLKSGDYVMLTISDTGKGMSPEVLESVFDPFFTTKEVGKGTGLGLPMVYGSVKQNDGFIYIYSEPGQGTTVKIYLPRFNDEPPNPKNVVEQKIPKGVETILLAEDEEAFLLACKAALERQGYTVLPASNPEEALTLATQHEGEIHMLLSDVVMPNMNGRELWRRVKETRPSIKCLFMSGYTADVMAQHGIIDTSAHFIEKPFSFRELAQKVRGVLDS
jgi:two-component system, cell cycle sensor histidine kinase and response regulator CckA